MDLNFWKKKWEVGEIGFHQAEVEPYLIEYFSDFTPGVVLVPLCGKSKDLLWLAKQGWMVTGVEASSLAAQAFFTENGISCEVLEQGGFTLYRSPKITIWCGDFFALPARAVQGVTALYDRAALIALPTDLRSKYVTHLRTLLDPAQHPQLQGLLLAIEYPQENIQGPPFSVDSSEIHLLYEGFLNIMEKVRIASTEIPTRNPKFAGVKVTETVYRLERGSRPS